ncbi:MAG: cupin domain-containing protein [Anaerolinea sp.]|nr:cupin domain-containing protein [Anaerolinea sp.]
MSQSGSSTPRPYVLHADQGVPGSGSDVKASRVSTGGMLTVIESRTTGGAPLHVHTHEDEYFYVVEGTITVTVGDETFTAGKGAFVFLPRGIPHTWDVVGGEATVLMITTPAMLEEFLAEYHAADREGRQQVAEKYGVTFF